MNKIMKCFDRKAQTHASTTTYFVDLKKCMIIVKNVPCFECEQCGEKYFTDETANRLDDIVETVGKLMTEIAVVDYTAHNAA